MRMRYALIIKLKRDKGRFGWLLQAAWAQDWPRVNTVSFSQSKQVADENHEKLVEMLGIWKSENEVTNKSTEEVMKNEVGKVQQILSRGNHRAQVSV